MTQEQTQAARKVSWLTVHFVLAAMIVAATGAIYLSSGRSEVVDWLSTVVNVYILLTFIQLLGHLWQYNELFRGVVERVQARFISSNEAEVTDG